MSARGAAAARGPAAVAARLLAAALVALATAAPRSLPSQERGAAALREAVDGLGVTARVLMIGAHPDDEDTQLLTWLARGRHVETAYLSLTRGDGGQNLIGNELGEALGAIRTEELLAARRLDGGHQYFTRAYDFGFSKSAEETLRHWPKDSLLADVVTVVRAFRPHVIVAVFSGTPRDGHGHHQVSGILAREAYELAGDTARLPRARTAWLGAWTPLKFYRAQRGRPADATLRFNVGEYDPMLGRSYYEIAAESRSQHRSQGFGVLERKGVQLNHVRREAARVGPGEAAAERSLFDGLDTTWVRPTAAARGTRGAAFVDSLSGAIAAARTSLDVRAPGRVVPALAKVAGLVARACAALPRQACADEHAEGAGPRTEAMADLGRSLGDLRRRVDRALVLATGIAVEAEVPREVIAGTGRVTSANGESADSGLVALTIYNRGGLPVDVGLVTVDGADVLAGTVELRPGAWTSIAPDSALRRRLRLEAVSRTEPWWLEAPRRGDMFSVPLWRAALTGDRLLSGESPATRNGVVYLRIAEDERAAPAEAVVALRAAGEMFLARVPVVRREADPVLGDVSRQLAVAPPISVTLDRAVEYARAGHPLERDVTVRLRSAIPAEQRATVRLRLPAGLSADTAAREVVLPATGARAVTFRVRGTVPAGTHEIRAVVESGGRNADAGYEAVEYPHIRTQRLYREALTTLRAVDVVVPRTLVVGYIPGVGDNGAPALAQLGIPVAILDPSRLGVEDLARFSTIVVGPRAYEAHDGLVEHNDRLHDFVRNGGTLVVQYQQYEILRPGLLPYPFRLGRPAARVTEEDAPVRILSPDAPVLAAPNRIGSADFAGWVQERALYMPTEIDARYARVLAMADPGMEPSEGALLVAPLGEGTYVYTTLSLFRQLPAGVPGAARIAVNLLSLGTGRVVP
ncbi:MAG TPA: PIG-L family deacetylase [Gemmatimonadaceae bacterium]